LGERTKVKWEVFAILVPEYLVGKALNDWLAARGLSRTMPEKTRGIPKRETIHGYYANIGGFVLDFADLEST